MKNQEWIPFYFEGNQWWGLVDSPEQWAALQIAYKKHAPYANILSATENPDTCRDVPSFGFYIEYDGDRTLSQWAEEVGLELT